MQKAVEILEKNVEWIAMGLAGVWVLWVIWAYGVSNRVAVEIDSKKYSPGTVDEVVRNEANDLNSKLTGSALPDMPAPNYTDTFQKTLDPALPKPLVLALNSPPAYSTIDVNNPTGPALPDIKVASLPKMNAPTELQNRSGKTQVVEPLMPPAAGNGAVAVVPTPPPAPAGGANVQPVSEKLLDKHWITVFAKFNEKTLDKNFDDVGIPPFIKQKQYIAVELQREALKPDGTFDKPVDVKPLSTAVPPVDRKLMPAQYIVWAADPQNQVMILEPPFYTEAIGPTGLVKGTKWELPWAQEAALLEKQPFDAMQKYQEYKALTDAKAKAHFEDGWTAEQKRDFYKIKTEQEDLERQNNKPAPQPRYQPNRGYAPPMPPTRGPVRGGYDALDPHLLKEMYASGPGPGPGPGGYGGYRPYDPRMMRGGYGGYNPYGGYRGPYGGYGGYGGYRPPMGQEAGQGFVRPANITPDANGNIDIWAHDETAEPGQAYRYRLRVVVKNPLYQSNIAAKKELSDTPFIPVDPNEGWSEWTKTVTIPSNLDMQLVGGNLNNKDTARFTVWRWQKGQTNQSAEQYSVTPGDVIGRLDKSSGVDYTTGWLVVDVREVAGDTEVRLINDSGQMETRKLNADRTDARYVRLHEAAERDKPPVIPAEPKLGTQARPANSSQRPRPG